MTHLKPLNTVFQAILVDPLNQDWWGDFDLHVLILAKEGYSFLSNVKFDLANAGYKLQTLDLETQLAFIDDEMKRAVAVQEYGYFSELYNYRKYISKLENCIEEELKVYDINYFVQEGKRIHYMLSGNLLLDMKFKRIIRRRTRI
jgi:protein associated with RNAse G/E